MPPDDRHQWPQRRRALAAASPTMTSSRSRLSHHRPRGCLYWIALSEHRGHQVKQRPGELRLGDHDTPVIQTEMIEGPPGTGRYGTGTAKARAISSCHRPASPRPAVSTIRRRMVPSGFDLAHNDPVCANPCRTAHGAPVPRPSAEPNCCPPAAPSTAPEGAAEPPPHRFVRLGVAGHKAVTEAAGRPRTQAPLTDAWGPWPAKRRTLWTEPYRADGMHFSTDL